MQKSLNLDLFCLCGFTHLQSLLYNAAGASKCIEEQSKLSSSSRATLSEVLAFGVTMLVAALV